MGTTFDSVIGTIIFANVFVMGIAYWSRIPDNTMFPVTGTCGGAVAILYLVAVESALGHLII